MAIVVKRTHSKSTFFLNSKSISTKRTLLGFPPLLISYSFGFIKNHVPLNENEPEVRRLHSKNKKDKGLWTPYLSRERCGRKMIGSKAASVGGFGTLVAP